MSKKVDSIICDEMIDPVVDEKLRDKGIEIYRPEPSETDEDVLRLARNQKAPILTRDRDFVEKHKNDEKHHGIIFDPRMHYRTPNEIVSALESLFEMADSKDMKNTLIRLSRFY